MFREKDLSGGGFAREEGSQSKLTRLQGLTQNRFNPDEEQQIAAGAGFFRDSKMGIDRIEARRSSSGTGNCSSQEPSFSYLNNKGKEIALPPDDSDKWVERDFLNLGQIPSKREAEEQEFERENHIRDQKRPKLETLNLSLAPPDVSLSLTASNVLRNSGQLQNLATAPLSAAAPAPSTTNNTQTTCSNDFTAPSMSYSYSLPFSHNPSCSLTRNSTENYDDPVWYAGEGTNGSVHSRFKPIGDGSVALVNTARDGGGTSNFLMQSSSIYRANSSADNHSYFLPSELAPRRDTVSGGDSRGRNSRGLEVIARRVPGPERLLREIVSMSVPIMAKTIQELPGEALESAKLFLKNLIDEPERKEELVLLQSRLDKRSDLTKETLVKCQKDQLCILVAVRTGLGNFISPNNRLPVTELIEIFLFMRCRNVMCKGLLPIDDCECKICSANKGFCSSCMCPICHNFDCAQNTCSWVGCDVCSHWCHASCGIERKLIRPGQSLNGPMGTTEMQFHCIGCDHASEMFGFVKAVFTCCAKDWGLETLVKELDCVRKIFTNSEDVKGRQLRIKAEELLCKLQGKSMSPSDACSQIIKFFNSIESMVVEMAASTASSREGKFNTSIFSQDVAALLQPSFMMMGGGDLHKRSLQTSSLVSSSGGLKAAAEDKMQRMLEGVDMFDSLESTIRIKEVEARMFQNKADEARREAETYKEMVCIETDKLEEEYAQRVAKLHLHEVEERRRTKLEELKVLENSHCDYQSMKLRMQAEIAGLLQRMEAKKQQLV